MPRETTDIAAFVRRARKSARLSQRALGNAAGIPQSHVAKIESGIDVRTSTLRRVLRALGYDLALRPHVRTLFFDPPPGSTMAAARDFGVDLGQLYASFTATPLERVRNAVRSANNLAKLLR